jgi:hypothetical protein
MQSRDPRDLIIQTDILKGQGPIVAARALSEKIEQARAKGAVKHVIAPLPNKGTKVTIDGLEYEVKYSNHKRGDLYLKLVGAP